MKFHVVTGAPCAGKSTYIKKHKGKKDILIDYDRLAAALYPGSVGNTHNFPELVLDVACDLFNVALRGVVTGERDTGGDVWIEYVRPTEEETRYLDGLGAIWHRLDVPEKICIERAKRDKRPQRTFGCINSYFNRANRGA